jgi:hypothetical protein
MGRYVSHPHAIQIDVQDGRVTLHGPILSGEVKPLLSALHWIPGLIEVHNQLEVYEHAGDVAALQS